MNGLYPESAEHGRLMEGGKSPKSRPCFAWRIYIFSWILSRTAMRISIRKGRLIRRFWQEKPVEPVIPPETELKLDELMKENAALREQLQIRREEQQQTYVPKPLDISEYKTRKLYIDSMLDEAGWIEGKNWLNEYEIPGMPNSSEVGFADYVLLGDDGGVLAVIEAKRTCVDVSKGRQQVKLYADLIEKMQGRRPV